MKKKFKVKISLIFGLLLGFLYPFSFLNAQLSSNWVGGVDANFYNENNWSNTTIDFENAQNTTLIINPGTPNNPIQNGGNQSNIDYRPNYLNVFAGAHATFNGAIIPWNNSYLNGTTTLNSPAYMNIRSAIYLGRTTDGILNLNGGSLHSRYQLYIGYDTGGKGIANVFGGTLYVGSSLEVATSPSGAAPHGVLNISGGVVEVNSGVHIGANGSIHISDLGALMVLGNHKIAMENFIANGSITSPLNTTLETTFDGSRTTVALAQDPNRLIKEYANYIILDNGILQARIDKATSNIESLKVNGVEILQQNGGSRSGTYYDFTGSYGFDKISGTVFSIKEETEDYIDVSFKRTYADGNYLAPCDADIHYVLKKMIPDYIRTRYCTINLNIQILT